MKIDTSRYLELRRDIHRHPELSNREVETTRRIRDFLAQEGLELQAIGDLNGGFVRIDAGKEKCAQHAQYNKRKELHERSAHVSSKLDAQDIAVTAHGCLLGYALRSDVYYIIDDIGTINK